MNAYSNYKINRFPNVLLIYFYITYLTCYKTNQAQTLPQSRAVDWTLAGLRADTIVGLPVIDLQTLGILNIESEKTIENVYICNDLGQVVQIQSINGRFGGFELGGLEAAVYFIRIEFEGKTIPVMKKIIKH